MLELSEKILEYYQTRKTKSQKTSFIKLMQENYPELKIEEGGLVKNRNLILGDVETAKTVVTAHYDTCARLPFPNFIAPKLFRPRNTIIFYLIILFLAVIVSVFFRVSGVDFSLSGNFNNVFFYALLLFLLGLIFLVFFGKPNEHTANDNTSGVIGLIEIYGKLSEEERKNVALVFFDNEEYGLFGSAFFKKMHKEVMEEKFLINLDCISDGDFIMLVESKKINRFEMDKFKDSIKDTGKKKFLYETYKTAIYPSDQIHFNNALGICALNYKKGIGYYMSRIHTKRDTVFEKENIELITNTIANYVKY